MTSRLISSSPAMTNKKHKAAIYWFRQDLRIDDNPTLIKACANVQTMVFVYCHPPQKITRWGFQSNSPHPASLYRYRTRQPQKNLSESWKRLTGNRHERSRSFARTGKRTANDSDLLRRHRGT